MQDLINQLDRLSVKEEQVLASASFVKDTLLECEEQKVKLEDALKVVQEAQAFYKKGVDIYYEESVGFLVKLINAALKEVIDDRDYRLEIILDDKRGKSLRLQAYKDGEETDLKDGEGMGICTVISAILHIYCLIELGSNYLFIDEKYSYLSEGYVENFFTFIKKFCKQFDFHLIMISHDPRFFNYVDKAYTVNGGVITESKV